MKKNSLGSTIPKKVALYNKAQFSPFCCENEASIRMGVALADEKADSLLRKRKLDAPPTIEERLLSNKFKNQAPN